MGLFDGTSLEQPVTCGGCGLTHAKCVCPRDTKGRVVVPSEQKPRVRKEKRRGKWCCVVADLDLTDDALKALLKDLRTKMGTGGGISDGDIVIQGDHREKIVAHLKSIGYDAKASGG